MRSYRQSTLLFFTIIIYIISACHTKQNGTIEGTVAPPGTSALITAIQNNKNILTAPVTGQNGKFKFELAAGIYTISAIVPGSHYPAHLHDIEVKPGEITILPLITLMMPAGKSRLSGKVIPAHPGTEVKLVYAGRERAAIHTDNKGAYEFKELPAGTYTVQANAPGHADDAAQVVVPDEHAIEHNTVLLPIVAIDGVDWTTGNVRAIGIGIPPLYIANKNVQREMTKRAALADAQRNMLRTIEQIRIDTDHTVQSAMANNKVASRVQGFLKGYTMISERELDNGNIEVVIELPLTGPAGLSRYIYNPE